MTDDKQTVANLTHDEHGRFAPGNRASPGRPRGSPNRSTAELREAILKALDRAGGAEYLENLARGQPETFIKLLLRLLPVAQSDDSEHGVRLIDPDPDV